MRTLTSRLAGAAVEGALISLLILALIAVPVLAGGHGGGKPIGSDARGTISMVPMDSTNGLAYYGQRVTFEIFTTATDSPFVQVRCSQDGALVYKDTQGYFPNALGEHWFVIGFTPAWQSGAADCTGHLMKWSGKGLQQLASTAFQVEP